MDKVDKIMAIAKTPREVDILFDKMWKLEKKMWKALTEEERLEYIRLRRATKESVEFEEYLRDVFEINNGIENDPDNLVRLHAPELLRLAKQHEPNIELIQRSWYLEGYDDRKNGMEPMWTVKAQEGGPVFEKNPKYGEPLREEANGGLEKRSITGWIKRNRYTKTNVLHGLDVTCQEVQGFNDGDRVKIIIVKQED